MKENDEMKDLRNLNFKYNIDFFSTFFIFKIIKYFAIIFKILKIK